MIKAVLLSFVLVIITLVCGAAVLAIVPDGDILTKTVIGTSLAFFVLVVTFGIFRQLGASKKPPRKPPPNYDHPAGQN